MSLMMQYIRQLNQESVQLRDPWLQQLRYCDSGSRTPSHSPQIVIAQAHDVEGNPTAHAAVPVDRSADLSPPNAPDEMVAVAATSLVESESKGIVKVHTQTDATATDGMAPEPKLQPLQVVDLATAESPSEVVELKSMSASQDSQPDPAEVSVKRFAYAQIKRHKHIDSLVNQILERFPATDPVTIMFLAIGREIDVDSISAKVSTCMSLRELGDILLVDGNLNSREMSRDLALGSDKGVAEFINRNTPLESIVRTTDNKRLNILPAGQGQLTHRKLDLSRVRRLTTELKRSFQYTIVSGGCVADLLADSLVRVVDAVYVLVEMTETDRNYAHDAVDYLRQLGARVVGCVTTQR